MVSKPYGTPGFPEGTFPSSIMSFLSARGVPGSKSELLCGPEERFDTITWPGYRPDARDCECAGPQFNSATHWENQSTTVPEYSGIPNRHRLMWRPCDHAVDCGR